MPCSDGGFLVEDYKDRDLKECSRDLQIKTARLDEVTQLLCELCGKLEKANILTVYGTKDLLQWWGKHKKLDLKRIAEEKIYYAKLAAIKQVLTQEEREALFTEEERKILGV